MISNQVALAIFFLYFVLMSGECSELMNCSLQRYINKNLWLKHIMIFLSIYIFTFILNWYTIESLVVEKFGSENKNRLSLVMDNYLVKSLLYSVLIYIIFVLSCKNEGINIAIFLIGSVLIVIGTVLTKSINTELYPLVSQTRWKSEKNIQRDLKEYSKTQQDETDIRKINKINNILFILSILLVLILSYGTIEYYLKQRIDHSKNWSIVKFWLGTHSCKHLI